jgi:hypothetical protein
MMLKTTKTTGRVSTASWRSYLFKIQLIAGLHCLVSELSTIRVGVRRALAGLS